MLSIYYDPIKHINASHTRSEAWNMAGQHYHNGYEIFLLIDGKRKMYVNGQNLELASGDMIIINPYILHYSKMSGKGNIERCVLNFSSEVLNGILTQSEIEDLLEGINTSMLRLNENQIKIFMNYYTNIQKNLYGKNSLSEKLADMYVIQLVMYLKEILKNARAICSKQDYVLRNDMIKVLKYIHNNSTNENLSLDMVVSYIHMSKSRFCELFKKTTGVTFLQYLNYLRITRTHTGLERTEKTLGKLAEENGFSSVAHMTRVFTAYYKISPSEFRREKNALKIQNRNI